MKVRECAVIGVSLFFFSFALHAQEKTEAPPFGSVKAPSYKVSPSRALASPAPEEKSAPKKDNEKVKKGKSTIAYEELDTLSQIVQIGDREDEVKKNLGEPAIVTTDDNNQLMWIYTQEKTINRKDCQIIKWKLIFKRGRLADWFEPKETLYAGNCSG